MEPDMLATLLAAPFGGPDGAMTPPIQQSSLFSFDNYQAFEDRLAGLGDRPLYTRVQNPTVAAFEAMMAQAEQGEAAVAFASGMAAISATVLALVRHGDRIACVEHVYPDAWRLFEQVLRPFGVTTDYHPVAAMEHEPQRLAGARLVYLESPNSLMMQAMDLARVAAHARAAGAVSVVDNSWATPVLQNPLALGVDAVVHSASKYIGGHSDTVAGVAIANADIIGRIRALTLPLLGAKLGPFEAWLLVRGLRTLPARMARHGATATLIAGRLAHHPRVARVHAPGAGDAPGLRGRSGLMSIELAEGADAPRFVDALRLFRIGVSWGGFESLVMPARAVLRQAGPQNPARCFGVPPTLVRLSLGLEDPQDLWRDLAQALAAA